MSDTPVPGYGQCPMCGRWVPGAETTGGVVAADHQCPPRQHPTTEDKMSKTYYGGPDDGSLVYTDRDEYIRSVLNDMDKRDVDLETIEVVEYRPMKPPTDYWPERVLEYLLESIDEEYGNPEGEWTQPTKKMEDLAKQFVDGVLAEYQPWACEAVGSETINVAEWRKEAGNEQDQDESRNERTD